MSPEGARARTNPSNRLAITANRDTPGVSGQSFLFRQSDNIGGDLVQSRLIEFCDAATSQEAVAGESRGPGAGSAGWQNVAWTGCVVPQGDRRMMSQEGGPTVADLGDLLTRICRFDVQVFRRKLVGQFACLRFIADQDQRAKCFQAVECQCASFQ